ncbi:hypothetical protein ACOJBO_09090 [Rhizobium beringeri]
MNSTIKERLPTHALAILGVTLFYRVATSMGPLAILLTLTEKLSLSDCIACAHRMDFGWRSQSTPLISVANRAGLQRTLLALGSVSFASHAGIGVVDGALAAVVLSTVAGASLPPVTAQARALLAHILGSSRLRAAFDAEAALASSAFVIAPLIVAVSSLAGKVGPTVGCAILLGAVSLAFGYVGRGIERGSKENSELSKREDDARMGWRTLALIFRERQLTGCLPASRSRLLRGSMTEQERRWYCPHGRQPRLLAGCASAVLRTLIAFASRSCLFQLQHALSWRPSRPAIWAYFRSFLF